MKADYHLGWKLRPDGDNSDNCYVTFFEQYNDSSFLTFNYDSLAEFILFRMGQWYPHDGYGVPVEVEMEYGTNLNTRDIKSSSLVLHLHGSLCIFTSKVDLIDMPGTNTRWLSLKEKPEYTFDPESISLLFTPFTSPPLQIPGPDPIEHRIIAPVPDKTKGFKQQFIKEVHSQALQLISKTNKLITIGYNFSPYDKGSYHHLIQKLAEREGAKGIVVSPNARSIEKQLKEDYPQIDWQAVQLTFKSWVNAGFPESMKS